MPFIIGLIILLISLPLCLAIDGLAHLTPTLSIMPLWLWLIVGSILLSWLMKDT